MDKSCSTRSAVINTLRCIYVKSLHSHNDALIQRNILWFLMKHFTKDFERGFLRKSSLKLKKTKVKYNSICKALLDESFCENAETPYFKNVSFIAIAIIPTT